MEILSQYEESARRAGITALRPPQKRVLKQIAEGENLLIIWPTGTGKSLCYQLPALHREGLTLVISPLIALMDDQIAKAERWGWPFTAIHSGVPRAERQRRLEAVGQGKVKLLMVTPERFRQPDFEAVYRRWKVSLLAVDEAHSISQWGHDFRPDYSRLGEFRAALGSPQTIALTATATKEVQKDILAQLGLSADTPISWEGVERPNLNLSAKECEGEAEKLEALQNWLREVEGPKIVYFTLIATLEKVAPKLRAAGFQFRIYHGELNDNERTRNQSQFLAGDVDLMLATPAFGLGVDKADVRGIAHFEVPGSLEAYYQEVGRAGRDGKVARCLMLYTQEDLLTQMRFIESLTPPADFIRAVFDRLRRWQDRLSTLTLEDLREQLSFKNKKDFRLETSLNLLERAGLIRWPRRRLQELEILRDWESTNFSPTLMEQRRLLLQKKLHAVVEWFRQAECRKVAIYKYFGWPNDKPCESCDRCGARG